MRGYEASIMWRARSAKALLPACHTRWSELLVTQPGTHDHEKLCRLDDFGAESFSLYARLHAQLSTRSLKDVAVYTGETHPFAWEHVRSNDFVFEDCMRIVSEAVRLCEPSTEAGASRFKKSEAARSRQLAGVLGMFSYLLQLPYVKALQTCSSLPTWLKHERLLALRKEASVQYVRAFADGFFLKKYPLETNPEPNLPVRFWLAKEGSDFDRAFLEYVRAEIMFHQAISEDSAECLCCARCYGMLAVKTGLVPRAAERVKYYEYFGIQHFPEIDFEITHVCREIMPEHPLDISSLLKKSEKPFSWDTHAHTHVFTL